LDHKELAIPGIWQGNGTKGGTLRLSVFDKRPDFDKKETCFVSDRIPEPFYELRDFGLQLTKSQKMYHPYCVANIEFVCEGCSVPRHIDDNYGYDNYDHMRFNLLISKPDSGGLPVIEDDVLDLNAGDAWYFLANKHYHECQEVVGLIPRISASFGYLK